MKIIYKFPVKIEDLQTLKMPTGAQILCVQMQGQEPFIWALIDTQNIDKEYIFELYGTGHEIHYDMGTERKYIGTFQTHGGQLVYHLFQYTGV